MAISLISQPKKYSPAHWDVPFVVQMSDLGTPPTRLDFGYYLADAAGTRLQEDKKYKPYAIGTDFHVNFRAISRRLVYTSFPVESSAAQTDANIIKGVKMKYGEVSYNSTTCATVKTITSDSNTFYLINAGANTDTHALWGTSSGFSAPRTGLLLHQRPDRWRLLHGSKDYLWYLGTGTIEIKYYNGATQLGSTQTFTLTGATTVKYVCLDYSLYSITAMPTHALVRVWDGTIDAGKEYRIEYCCCARQDDYLGVLYLEPMGGRAMLATGRPVSVDIERTGSEVNLSIDLTQLQHKSGGRTVLVPVGTRKIAFETEVIDAAGLEKMLQNFASSAGHHAQRGYGANLRWEKFILDSGSVRISERNKIPVVAFSGYISEGVGVQSQDI